MLLDGAGPLDRRASIVSKTERSRRRAEDRHTYSLSYIDIARIRTMNVRDPRHILDI